MLNIIFIPLKIPDKKVIHRRVFSEKIHNVSTFHEEESLRCYLRICLKRILFENICKKFQMTEADSKVPAGPRLGF